MKITVLENEQQSGIEVVIHCRKNDGQVQRLCSMLSGSGKRLTGTKGGRTFILEPSKLLYFDSVDKKTFAYSASEVYEVGLRLYELEERLPPCFFRASKAAIINLDKITSIRPDFGGRLEVVMSSGERLAVSRQYAQGLKTKLEM